MGEDFDCNNGKGKHVGEDVREARTRERERTKTRARKSLWM